MCHLLLLSDGCLFVIVIVKFFLSTQLNVPKPIRVGDVVYADIPRNPQGRSRGFGIVRYSNTEEAQKAIEQFNGYEWNGRPLVVREDKNGGRAGGGAGGAGSGAPSGGAGGKERFQLFVGNLPWSVTWQDLKDLAKDNGLSPIRADVATG